MTIHFNLHRFGADEFAVGRLINGDLPDDDEERWQILDAPRWHIRRMLDQHRHAQQILRECRDEGRRFVAFLRSFSVEHRGVRVGADIGSQVFAHSLTLQRALSEVLAPEGVALVKLHGGSDPLTTSIGEREAAVLSTHALNWIPVAADLIASASAVVFLLGDASEGVQRELELIASMGRQDRCLVLRSPGARVPPGFSHVFDFDPGHSSVAPGILQALRRSIVQPSLAPQVEAALGARFVYCEPEWIDSPDHHATERLLWRGLRMLRVVLDPGYWNALEAAGVDIAEFTFPGPWIDAHRMYGLAIAACDFAAIREALSLLFMLYVRRGADFALVIPRLKRQYDELAAEIDVGRTVSTELRYAEGPDPFAGPPDLRRAADVFLAAQARADAGDVAAANDLFQAAAICALRTGTDDAAERIWTLAHICRDWAIVQGAAGQLAWAVANVRYAVVLLRSRVEHDEGRYRPALALTLNNLGALLHRRGDFKAAEPVHDEALAIRRALAGNDAEARDDLAHTLANLGLLMAATGRPVQARALYDEAIASFSDAALRERVREWTTLLPRADGSIDGR